MSFYYKKGGKIMPEPEKPKLIQGRKLTQLGMMRAFWRLLTAHGGMTIKSSELMDLPVNAALKADYNAGMDSFTITPIIGQPKGIITPDKGIIN